MKDAEIRTIQPGDDPYLAAIIRDSLSEFGANKPGTVFFDPTTDHLFEFFQVPSSVYYVLTQDQKILGGAGIFPSPGLPKGTCELVKMYLKPEARGRGYGKMLITKCIEFARSSGYDKIYIETMPELKKALAVYEKFGFRYIRHALGNTGHYGCDVWMLMDLSRVHAGPGDQPTA